MESKQAIDILFKQIFDKNSLNGTELADLYLIAIKDTNKVKRLVEIANVGFKTRHDIAMEYEKWCEDNKAMKGDSCNMITWMLSIKLKEWLK